jgi:hypothetical protein
LPTPTAEWMRAGASKQGTNWAIHRIGETEIDHDPDTSTRKSIKGARVPLMLLGCIRRGSKGFISLHYGFLLPPVLAVSMNLSLMEGGSTCWRGFGRDPTFISRDLWDLTTIRQLTHSRIGTLRSTPLSTSPPHPQLTKSLHPHRSLILHHPSSIPIFPIRSLLVAKQNGRVSAAPITFHQNTSIMRNNWS